MWLYILIPIGSITIAFIIAYFVEKFGVASKMRIPKTTDRIDSKVSVQGREGLQKTVFEQINVLLDSPRQGAEISRKVSSILDKELEKRMELGTQEMRQKYEKIIQEKAKNEETARKRYRKVLTEKKSTDAVIRSIAEGLVVIDAQGKVIMMNPAAENLLGVEKKEKVGKSLVQDLKDEQLLSLVKSSSEEEAKEIELMSPDDETKKILRASSAIVENEDGQTVGMVSMLSDITRQKELDNLKASFVSNVSHELRTPLIAVDKSLTLLLDKTAGPLSSEQEQFLSIASRNLKRLSILINDLLDISKLEAGKMELHYQSVSIKKVINEAVESFTNWAETKSIKLTKRIQDGIPEMNIDPNKIIQVLNNLIGNALKFTPDNGEITIEANTAKGAVQISVKDTGSGIPQGDIPKIFDKFYQTAERAPTDISGTGLGLSIAKEIVDLHGGDIWVESNKSEGATFIFTLPLKK
ncbi:MAG: PAS domain-containing protein [Candidatus Omnitrophota bacterium]|nr:MAG: PAS domain-containing protein [Candidatus Omnitrophota bacterium]